MRFGLFFELQCPRPWGAGAEAALFGEALEQAELADAIGIQHLWAQEHHFLEEYSHSSAPEVFLAACSQRTRRIRLGHGIALMPPAYNHPARNAERIAALDAISGGRVEWGTGESSSRLELEGFQVAYPEKRGMWAEAVRECARMMCMTPYPGHQGRFFAMPARNVVPKPLQTPHPPLWLACSNRETVRLAARLGMGALTFSFMDSGDARYWVEEYYETFKSGCTPIGRSVNPNIAVLSGFMTHPDGEVARARAAAGLRFFAYGLSHYFRSGVHVPGVTDLHQLFTEADAVPVAGMGGIGAPDEVAEELARLEDAGVDQVILLQQAAGYAHTDICASLRLFGEAVLPGFLARDGARQARKQAELAPYIARALERIEPLETAIGDPVAAYPLLLERASAAEASLGPRRAIGSDALWQLHVAPAGDPKVDADE